MKIEKIEKILKMDQPGKLYLIISYYKDIISFINPTVRDHILDSEKFKEPAANYWSRDMPVDPNEPIYCNCRRVAYGEMICCDNTEVSLKVTSMLVTDVGEEMCWRQL